MSENLTVVTVEQVVELAREMGCKIVELKSFIGIEAPEFNKKAIFVGRSKRRMTRLDVAGFVPEAAPGLNVHDEEWAKSLKLGAVRAQLLPKEIRDESVDVLATCAALFSQLLDPTEGFKLAKRQPKSAEEATEESTSEETQTEEVAGNDDLALAQWAEEHAAEAAIS